MRFHEHISNPGVGVNTSTRTDAGLKLGQRRRRWPTINPASAQFLLFAEMCALGGHHSISRGGGLEGFFEINNFGRTLREINNLLQELFYINMW